MDKTNELTQKILVQAATMNTDAIYAPQKSRIKDDIKDLEASLKELKSLVNQQRPGTTPGFLFSYAGGVSSPEKPLELLFRKKVKYATKDISSDQC